MKKMYGGIFILHMCTINDNHIMHGSWDMECNTYFFVILDHFLPFSPLTTWKIKILKNWKEMPGHIISQMCTVNATSIWCLVPEIWSATGIILCHFGPSFTLYPTNSPKNQTFEKMNEKKLPRHITISHKSTKNNDHMLHFSWYMAHDGCNFYFSSWAIFSLFTHLKTQKIKILKNEKNVWRYHFTLV